MNIKQIGRKIQHRLPPLFHPRRVRIVLSDGKAFVLTDPFSLSISTALAFHQDLSYEEETLFFFKKALSGSSVFFDIGANMGIYTLVALLYHPKIRVYSFEPVPQVFKILRNNVLANHGEIRVRCEEAALTDFVGTVNLYVNGDCEASTLLGFRSEVIPIQVRSMSLDAYCSEHQIDFIDILKVDTEGTEPTVLRGGREIIKRSKPIIFCEVLRGRTEAALEEFLFPLGYHYFHITEKGLVPKEHIEGDETYRYLNYMFAVETPRG